MREGNGATIRNSNGACPVLHSAVRLPGLKSLDIGYPVVNHTFV